MAPKKIFLIFFVLFINNVHSGSILEKSYQYVMSMGKNFAPSLMTIFDCFGENEVWNCARDRAVKILDSWNAEVDKQRKMWQASADAEVVSSGRSFKELPSQLGKDVEESLRSLTEVIQQGMARALSRKKHESEDGGIDITVSASSEKKKKMKKKKQKPPKIQLVQPVMMPMDKMEDKGGRVQSWVIGTESAGIRQRRDIFKDAWNTGEKMLDEFAEHALASDASENGIVDKSSAEEQRGKKKKKKKAILKLLILGAVLKAKIGTLLQILSFKLQVKFFIIALVGLAINLARFWVELKNKHNQAPQKVIYYEHAQHQHHYEHEEEPGWGPWSRSIDPEDGDGDDAHHLPYRAHEKNAQVYPTRPLLTLNK